MNTRNCNMQRLTTPALSRRRFLAAAAAMPMASSVSRLQGEQTSVDELDRILRSPVLETGLVKEPVKIRSIELLHSGRVYLLRIRSTSGVEAVTVPNPSRMAETYPIFLKRIAPFFLNQDARQLESLLWELYRSGSNYKLQGIALWAGVAAIEMGLLELLGQTAGRPLADFFGGTLRREIPVYYASGNRGNTPEAEVEHLHNLVSDSGAKAIKIRLGGRMSRNADSLPGRTDALIPLVRKSFGDQMTLYGDSNSSYDSPEAIRVGRLLEASNYGFYEEPCQFDDLWSTKAVADALTIPVAGGEQEFSMHRWKWTIANRGVDVVQPDLHYGGGFIRATRVARMAAAAGIPVVPHMSGGGLGYVDVVQFASFTPNIGPFMEFKGNTNLPVLCDSSSLKCQDGHVRCPAGVGMGVSIDPNFVKKADNIEL